MSTCAVLASSSSASVHLTPKRGDHKKKESSSSIENTTLCGMHASSSMTVYYLKILIQNSIDVADHSNHSSVTVHVQESSLQQQSKYRLL